MTANRVDQADYAPALRDHEARIRALEANPIVGSGAGVLIAGSVFNDGNIILPASAPGFSIVLVTVGSPGVPAQYDITFDTPLAVIPVIQLTPNNNNGASGNDSTYQAGVMNGTPATTGFSVLTIAFNPLAASNDGGFDFACFTPGPAGT